MINTVTLVCGKLSQTLTKDHAQRVLCSLVNKKAGWKLPNDSEWKLSGEELVKKSVGKTSASN